MGLSVDNQEYINLRNEDLQPTPTTYNYPSPSFLPDYNINQKLYHDTNYVGILVVLGMYLDIVWYILYIFNYIYGYYCGECPIKTVLVRGR